MFQIWYVFVQLSVPEVTYIVAIGAYLNDYASQCIIEVVVSIEILYKWFTFIII